MVTISAAASDARGVTSVTFRVDGAVIGTDTKPPYSVKWNTRDVADGSHTLRAEARDAAGNVAASAPVTVTVGSGGSSPDATAPSVNITSPAGGAQVTGTVGVAAIASDDVGVTSVTFLVDAIAIGTDTSYPYSINWNAATTSSGSHTLRAEARDAAGNVGVSTAVVVDVMNRPPSVTMTAPSNGSTYQAPATITLAANAADSDGSVSRVDFFDGSTRIGSDTTSPFSFTWTASSARTYVLSATAVDNAGAATASTPVSVTVVSPSRLTKAVFEPSADHSTVVQYVLDVFRDGTNTTTGAPVATQNLGKPAVVNGEVIADIAVTTASLSAGTYVATVSAVTSAQRARSAPSSPFVIPSSTSLTGISTGLLREDAGSTGGWRASANESRTAPPAAQSHGTVWVTDSSAHMVIAFDATTGDVRAMIPVGLTPTGIAVPIGARKIYVANEGSDTVSVISKDTMTLSATIVLPAPAGRKPHRVSGSPDGRFVYVGEFGANVVDVIDSATDQISARFSTGWPGSQTRAVVSDPSGAVLYGVNRGAAGSASTLVALDAETGRWLWYLALGGDPIDFAITSDGRTGIVTHHGDSRIELIDLERRVVVNHIDFGFGNHAGTLQMTRDSGLLLVMLGAMRAEVGIVDLATATALPPVSLGGSASGAAVPAGQLIYASVSGSSGIPPGVVAIDPSSGSVVHRFRIPGGGSPRHVVFDPD
jgi:YVTN family beta-propeller protein